MKVARFTLMIIFTAIVVTWAHDTLLLLFTGVLIALMLHSTAAGITRLTRLPQGLSLGCVIIGVIAIVAVLCFWRGSVFILQLGDLSASLPHAVDDVLRRYNALPWDTWFAQRIKSIDMTEVWKAASGASSWILSSTFSAFASVGVILFTGVCFAAEPATYVKGFTLLFQDNMRPRITMVLEDIGRALQAWLCARFISMVAVGAFVTIGLIIIKLPHAGTLGILAGVLSFIPNVGALSSSIPAIVLALARDPTSAMLVIGIYWIAHVIDDFIVLPIAERRIVSLPPVLTITAQLLLVGPAGILGIMLAAPLVATGIVVIERLWVERFAYDQLKTRT